MRAARVVVLLLPAALFVAQFAACGSDDGGNPMPKRGPWSPDALFWETDVAPIDACPMMMPWGECDAPGLKCVVPCYTVSGGGYQAYCDPLYDQWQSTSTGCSKY